MAKATPHQIFDDIFGVLGKQDKTLGRAPGLGLTIGRSEKGSILGIKRKKPNKVSSAQADQRSLYSAADCSYKELCPGHRILMEMYLIEYNRTHKKPISDIYHFHMHIQMTVRKTESADWVDNFDGFNYTGKEVLSWDDGFNGPDWGKSWKLEWYEGFNS